MTVFDISFRLTGGPIPVDHGYRLYSALSSLLMALHGDMEIGIHPINGNPIGNRLLAITPSSQLTVRVPAERIPDILAVAGEHLDIGGNSVIVGVPSIRTLVPAASLCSRLVVIKGFMEPEAFLDAVRRQLAKLDVRGTPISSQRVRLLSRIGVEMEVRNRVGYAVRFASATRRSLGSRFELTD